MHPDNLIPSCHDSNRGDHKADVPPLDWAEKDQAAQHFHPRWRSGAGKFKVTFTEKVGRPSSATLEALNPADQTKVDNIEKLFKLAEFWGRRLSDDVQTVQKEIADDLRVAGGPFDASAARGGLWSRSRACRRWLNIRERQYYWQHLYAYAAVSTPIIQEILRQYQEDVQFD